MQLNTKVKTYLKLLAPLFGVVVFVALFRFALGKHLDEPILSVIYRFVAVLVLFPLITVDNRQPRKKWFLNKRVTFSVVFILSLFFINNLLMIHFSNQINYFEKGITAFVLSVLSIYLGSIGEELFYRGIIQPSINRIESVKIKDVFISKGNLIASCIMLLPHIYFFYEFSFLFATSSFLLVFVFSLTVGYIQDYGGHLLIPITLHIVVNTLHVFIHTLG